VPPFIPIKQDHQKIMDALKVTVEGLDAGVKIAKEQFGFNETADSA